MTVPEPALRDAGLSRRLAALAMDAALLAAGFGVINLLLWKTGVAASLRPEAQSPLLELWRSADAAWSLAAVLLGAILTSWRAMGATPGALLLGVVVITRGGDRPGWPRCALRLAVSLMLPGVGLLWSLGGRPALHDRLSRTRLVMEDEVLQWPDARMPRGAAT